MSTIVLALSFVLQFSAAIGASRPIKLTGHLWAWSLIAPALTLMGLRRSITFYWAVAGDVPQPPELIAELVALCISLLLVIGVFRIKPLLAEVVQSTKTLQQSREDFRAFAEVSSDFFWTMSSGLPISRKPLAAYPVFARKPCLAGHAGKTVPRVPNRKLSNSTCVIWMSDVLSKNSYIRGRIAEARPSLFP